ncbi:MULTISPECIES: DUF3099 domain-containing protein [Micromonospora]|uniref:DUF3099 domain-containing protein n=2 Tax=Micromonospora TaxID=1873 RepID=A0A9X0LFZ4_9ACTN|nr:MULTISPECIES: DUF3099 domain-containing protein [Micromonospora]AEB43621.1 hypothetical protein VAB18032_12535 [Micromonospora maris AB-18-032]KUJ48917.1 hypothetical protein ADL17_07970 [Micromonospora maris]MBL6274688.1 DUF3099 domain-containing protein [Micromonospora fiedleri]RUL91767.1 DUF3099 domain-containing protein [Verrucosispora sp. FIM060022]WSK44601.1 DUF3099 domain-containing protein [Micromonospora maris]
MKRQAYRPILITDASRSQDDQLTTRQRRYVMMMCVRAACVVVGAILVGAKAPLLWLWLPLVALGMLIVPWLAVLLANDRPPKDEHRFANRFRRGQPTEAPARSLTAEERPHKVIDAEP